MIENALFSNFDVGVIILVGVLVAIAAIALYRLIKNNL